MRTLLAGRRENTGSRRPARPSHRLRSRLLASALTAITAAALALLLLLGIGPRVADYRTMTMLSGSMAPNCPTGSLVIARPQPAPELRTGQVLTYHIPLEDHRVVSHRIIGVERQDGAIVVRTKGDANNGPDPWQARIDDQTAWTVRSCIPHVGNVLLALRQPLVLPVVKWLLPGILLTWLLAGIWWPRGRHG